MRDGLWTKGLVLGIIMLFVGTSVLPDISANILTDINKGNKNNPNENLVPLDQLDQYQNETRGGGQCIGIIDVGETIGLQSFTPNLNVLSRVELVLEREYYVSHDLIVCIESGFSSKILRSISVPKDSVKIDEYQWISIDFEDIHIRPGRYYYIEVSCLEQYPSCSYSWLGEEYDQDSPYPRGQAYGTNDGGKTWNGWLGGDFCFRTYGYMDYPPYSPNITGEVDGIIGNLYNYTIQTIDPENEDIYYYIDWGDGSSSGWKGPFNSGETINVSHSWDSKGTYTIRAKAKDIYGGEGNWSNLTVIVTSNIHITGGFGVSAVIKNNGNSVLTDIAWSIDVSGGIILSGGHTEGTIDELAVGASTTIKAKPRGIGRITITVQAGDAVEEATAFLLGPLVLRVSQ